MRGLLKPNPTRDLTETGSRSPVHLDEDELLTDEEACAFLKVKKQWLRDHTTRVEPIVPHIRTMGRQIKYSKRALSRWVQEQIETRPSWQRKKAPAEICT